MKFGHVNKEGWFDSLQPGVQLRDILPGDRPTLDRLLETFSIRGWKSFTFEDVAN